MFWENTCFCPCYIQFFFDFIPVKYFFFQFYFWKIWICPISSLWNDFFFQIYLWEIWIYFNSISKVHNNQGRNWDKFKFLRDKIEKKNFTRIELDKLIFLRDEIEKNWIWQRRKHVFSSIIFYKFLWTTKTKRLLKICYGLLSSDEDDDTFALDCCFNVECHVLGKFTRLDYAAITIYHLKVSQPLISPTLPRDNSH